MPTFTILTGKEGSAPKKPLFLVTIVAPDGDTTYLTTAAYYGAPNISYNGHTYLARIQNNEIAAIQAISPQGYDSLPGFTMTLADADKSLWMNHCITHGWRGSTVTLTVILWDVVANAYSTDALQWLFIGGNPQHNHAQGQTTVDVTAATNFTRLKVPSIALQYRCPWDFPTTLAQRTAALKDPTSIYYQCGYSADVAGGVGNLTGGVAFTSCDLTRSSPTDPSVGCMARLGKASATSVAPDGDIAHDIAGNPTGRFGGVTWMAGSQFSGRAYTSGQKVFGFNQPNTSLAGSFYNWVYGTQWVQCHVLAPAGDPNSLRSEAVVCVSAFGPARVQKLLVNGVEVPQGGGDKLFTWRYINQGGRNGSLNGDAIYNSHGDPHGSVCCIEFVVPAQLASPGSIPTVQALVTSGPILNCYAIASVTSGVVTFTGPNWTCAGGTPFVVIIAGNSNPALNTVFGLTSWTGGNPGTITLSGSSASGTGGFVFFYAQPDLWDTGGSIISNPTGQDANIAGPACNLPFAALDLMTWGNINMSQVDGLSWYNAAQISAAQLNYKAADGSTQTHAQYKASFALLGNSRQTLAQVLTALRNAGNLMIAPNSTTGLIQCFVKQTLGDQQSSIIAGSNDTNSRSSVKADGTSQAGYYAYTFDETNIEKDSFRVTTTKIESTPNTVAFQFQDENNGYQQDSLTEIDPISYAYSGNQEIAVPVPILGCPNFDQGMRIANTQLGEALFGNPRNDAGGTLYFEFRSNQRVLHLASRLGYICGLRWQALGIGVSAPQAIRLLSVKPDTDGEHWDIKAAWHRDDWYTYAYGQDPAPFQRNPLLAPPDRPPYPWRPGVTTWGASDALFPGHLGFDCSVDTSAYPAQLTLRGAAPLNGQPSGKPPLVPLQATVASTGGTIVPGTYLIAFSVNGAVGPVSNFVTAVVPAGTNTNKITIAGIQWQDGAAPSIKPFVGESALSMRAAAGASYTGSVADANGNPTTYVFTSVTVDGLGLPDINFREFLIEETGIIHGGVWGDSVTSVAGSVLTFANGAWTTNQWQNYVLSLYYRPGADPQPVLNIVVSSSTATTLTMASAGFLAGDVVVMRAKAGSITASTIGDANFVNSYAPSGLTVNDEAGMLIQIIAGTGAGSSPKVIASNTATVFTILGTWDVTLDATSVFIVIEPTLTYAYTTNQISNGSSSASREIATTPAIVTAEQSLLVRVSTADVNGNTAPRQYQPFREVYIPPQSVLSSGVVLSVGGTLAIGSNLAPLVLLTSAVSPTGVNAQVKQAPTGATLTIEIYAGASLWMTLTLAAATTSIQATPAQLSTAGPLPALQNITINLTAVGTTFPGADLSVIIFT